MSHLDQRGVTLVELLVAMFLLATALLGLAASFPYAMYGVTAGGYQTTATLLAQQRVDVARNTLYQNLCALAATEDPVATYGGFRRITTVGPCGGGVPTSTLTTVQVVVQFRTVIPFPLYDTTVMTQIVQ